MSSKPPQVIVSTACQSAGEALRAIDQKDVIKTDFVLVSGDVVSNMNLVGAMQEHRARRERNKSAIMTMARPSICNLHVREGNGHCVMLLYCWETWQSHDIVERYCRCMWAGNHNRLG